jgi:hypothetical protein
LRGLLAHRSDQWFAQMGTELYRTREDSGMAGAIFDGYLCSAEYLLYGPTPYAEVMELARDLRGTAERSGARRAAAFARALTGEAHSLQRLAEVRLAQGDDAEARRLLDRAFPLARSQPLDAERCRRTLGAIARDLAGR